jgi:tetratricopeptide (TPR) repeat protein
VLIAITIACVFAARRRSRAPLVGWLWFTGTLVPMIGLVQVGAASHADRYTYFPLIGVFIMFAWLLPTTNAPQAKWSGIVASTCAIALAAVCWFQIGYWRDSLTLAARALSVTSDNATAHTLMGEALTSEGGAHVEEAIAHLQEATRIDPNSPQAWHNLGFAYAQAAMNEQAMDAYRRAIALRPDFAENHYNLGLLLKAAGQNDEARASLQMAIECAEHTGDSTLAERTRSAIKGLTIE